MGKKDDLNDFKGVCAFQKLVIYWNFGVYREWSEKEKISNECQLSG